MCKRAINTRIPNPRIDRCLRQLMKQLNFSPEVTTCGSCCGHGKYPLTIIVKNKKTGKIYDLITGIEIPRVRNFYLRDEEGYYFIPEVSGKKSTNI